MPVVVARRGARSTLAVLAVSGLVAAGACSPASTAAPLETAKSTPYTDRAGDDAADVTGDGQSVLVVGGRGTTAFVARSADDGATWAVSHPDARALSRVSAADGTALASGCAGDTGCVYRSRDGGATWSPVAMSPSAGAYTDATALDAARWWAHLASSTGSTTIPALISTGDAGSAWSPVVSPCPAAEPVVQGLAPVAEDRLWAVCVATAGGDAWAVVERSSGHTVVRSTSATDVTAGGFGPAGIYDFAMLAAGVGWIATSSGLFATTDGGATWRGLPEPGGGWVSGVDLVDASLGYAVDVLEAEFTKVFETRDGGKTWREIASWRFYG